MDASEFDTQKAARVQLTLSQRCRYVRDIEMAEISCVGGVDASYSGSIVRGAAAVVAFPSLELCSWARSSMRTKVPYIPGFFSFRELPSLIKALRMLDSIPDVVLVNGHGYAHPRHFGIACHLGVLLDVPTVGVASRPLVGTARPPGNTRGSATPLIMEGTQIGLAVRTMRHSRPLYVSAGHRTDLSLAYELVMETSRAHRVPEPLRIADRISKEHTQFSMN
jgi:deoxyribonuclease V